MRNMTGKQRKYKSRNVADNRADNIKWLLMRGLPWETRKKHLGEWEGFNYSTGKKRAD